MKDFLYKLNMNDNFDNWEPVSNNSIRAFIHEICCKYLEENIHKMRKLKANVKFKKHFEVQTYILSFMSYKRRSYQVVFRSAILLLQY